jgi:transposase
MRSPIVAAATELAQAFARLLCERGGQQPGAWVQTVEAAEIPELRAFAAGLRKDGTAVEAGLTLPWSSGAVEGHVNRINMLERQIYGRANVDLLRRRVLVTG